MGLDKGLCDSCGEVFDVLFPVGILDECPTGGMKHVQKWYCVTCKDVLEEEAETNKDGEEDKAKSEQRYCPKCSSRKRIGITDEVDFIIMSLRIPDGKIIMEIVACAKCGTVYNRVE